MVKLYRFITPLYLLLSLLIWSEDALVQPKGTLQISMTDLMISTSRVYNSQGGMEDVALTTHNNLGGSLEMGITPYLTAELTWLPGINIYTQTNENNMPAELKDRIEYDGLADINGGIKFQVQKNSLMRTALGLGCTIPLDSLDAQHEVSAFLSGDNFRLTSQNKTEIFGIWTRLFWDINLNEVFFLNVYNQIFFNFSHTGYHKLSVIDFLTVYYAVLQSGGTTIQAENLAFASMDQNIIHHYALEIDLEAELHFFKVLANNSQVDLSLPLHYRYTPETLLNSYWNDRLSGHIFTLNPSLSFRTERFNFPIELRTQFSFPIWGVNKSQSPLIALQAKLFFDFY